MGDVDDFLEDAAVELESVQKENATLKAKMKVLVTRSRSTAPARTPCA